MAAVEELPSSAEMASEAFGQHDTSTSGLVGSKDELIQPAQDTSDKRAATIQLMTGHQAAAGAGASQDQDTALELTPEQDAAAAECANGFINLYEHAYLNRAVQLVARTCEEQGIPEAAVAQKLRAKGLVLSQLQARAAEVAHGIAECNTDESWRLISDDGKLRLMYRHETGSSIHSFKGSCLLPAPIEQPLSMAREFDLVNTWNSYITNSVVLRTFCDVDLLVYASVWFPWPFAERDVLIAAVADDQLKEQGVVAVSFASPIETPADVELPDGADQHVRVYFTSGSCMTMQPVAPGAAPAAATTSSSWWGSSYSTAGNSSSSDGNTQQTQVVVVANIETSMAYVPEAIIQFVLRVFAPFMYSAVVKVLTSTFGNPSEALPKRVAEHHKLYDQMRQRCQDYLDGHPD